MRMIKQETYPEPIEKYFDVFIAWLDGTLVPTHTIRDAVYISACSNLNIPVVVIDKDKKDWAINLNHVCFLRCGPYRDCTYEEDRRRRDELLTGKEPSCQDT